MTRISVCLTHYNRTEKLAATLESLARQTLPPDEVFVWDDTSPVDPHGVVMQFRDRFRRLVYHRNVKNLGMPGNLNAVLAQATGDYVANLHDADIYHPLLLEKWVRALNTYPSAGMVYCGLKTVDKHSGEPLDSILPVPLFMSGRTFFRERMIGNLSCPIWGTAMVRKRVHDQLLPLDARFRNWADIDYWMRICLNHDIAYVPEALITLDHTDTAERRFSWFRVLIVHETYIVNIRRHFANDPEGLRQALRRQSNFLRKRYPVLMLRTLRQRNSRAFWNGVQLFPQIFSDRLHEMPETLTDYAEPHR